jgi:hypothetical protein
MRQYVHPTLASATSGQHTMIASQTDGLDDDVWQTICDAVSAAHSGDPDATHAATDRFAARRPFDSQPNLYLTWLLRYRVADVLGHRPSAAELLSMAEAARSASARILRDPAYVDRTLLTVWKLASAEQELESGQLLVGLVAALGVLLTDPLRQLQEVRPQLADWFRRNLDKFTADGFLDDRSTPEARRVARWPSK